MRPAREFVEQERGGAILGLAIVETLGIGMCILTLLYTEDMLRLTRGGSDITGDFRRCAFVQLVVLLFVTWVGLVFNRHHGPQILRSLIPDFSARRLPGNFYCINLTRYVWVTAGLNFLFLNIMIWATEGPRESLYTSFLVIMVPVYSLLRARYTQILVLLAASVLSFMPAVFPSMYRPLEALWGSVELVSDEDHNILFFGITCLCVVFPALLSAVSGDVGDREPAPIVLFEPPEPKGTKRPLLGEILVGMKAMKERHVARVLDLQKRQGGLFGDIAVRTGYCREQVINEALASQAKWMTGGP